MENNIRIIKNIENALKMVREQLNSEELVKQRNIYSEELLIDIASRLDIGAEKYGMQVPIEESDGRIFTQEAYEELLDAVVYISSIGLNKISIAKTQDERMDAHLMGNILFNIIYQTMKFMELINGKKKT